VTFPCPTCAGTGQALDPSVAAEYARHVPTTEKPEMTAKLRRARLLAAAGNVAARAQEAA
jgi:hypothetical protein